MMQVMGVVFFSLAAIFCAAQDVMIKADGKYYLFCTGNGITSCLPSDYMKNWKPQKPAFVSADLQCPYNLWDLPDRTSVFIPLRTK